MFLYGAYWFSVVHQITGLDLFHVKVPSMLVFLWVCTVLPVGNWKHTCWGTSQSRTCGLITKKRLRGEFFGTTFTKTTQMHIWNNFVCLFLVFTCCKSLILLPFCVFGRQWMYWSCLIFFVVFYYCRSNLLALGLLISSHIWHNLGF